MGYCGGSARCGILDNLQLKGVGKNQLHGTRPNSPADSWHSSGTVCVSEAGREAIWSSVCEAALPYGAVASLAIVLTGTRTSEPSQGQGTGHPPRRALLVREPALRPAHFLRNVYFHASNPPTAKTCQDTERTGIAIHRLADAFAQAFEPKASDTVISTINSGLLEMARRFAAQLAASFAKRIFHGGLCSSNIALDGRFLDFGTMTTVSAYRRRSGAPIPGGPDSWTQHTQLATTIAHLHTHVARFLKCSGRESLISVNEIHQEFYAIWNTLTEIELLKLTGVAEPSLEAYPVLCRTRLCKCLSEFITRGAKTPYILWDADDERLRGTRPLESTGKYDLNQILSAIAHPRSSDEIWLALSAEVDDVWLARELRESYSNLVDWHCSKYPDGLREAERVKVARNAQRVNSDVSFLTREALEVDLKSFDIEPEGLDRYIHATVARAKAIFEDTPQEDAAGIDLVGREFT